MPLGRLLGCFGSPLGLPWAPFGITWVPLGLAWVSLVELLAILDVFWGAREVPGATEWAYLEADASFLVCFVGA